jgi:succinate-semialdehyde dehydrogenase/glutarate-semialdehyde dehydrogenase
MSELQSINPSTGEVVGSVVVTPVDQVAEIVATARRAQKAWGALDIAERARIVGSAAPAMHEAIERVGALLTAEMGKPLREAMGEVRSCASGLEAEVVEIAEALAPEILEDGRSRTTLYRDPLGVCAAITPWNFPFSMPHWMCIPALVAGNTVILKPSEETPLVAAAYVEILQSVLPDGVLQIVHGDEAQGKALVGADVDLVAFTGSRAAGSHILAAAAGSLKRVVLELGGKDPLVVLDDADVDRAAKFAVRNSFRNAGQVCVSTERILVAESIADDFEAAMVRHAESWRVGDGTGEVDQGPMISLAQRQRVADQVRAAIDSGARVIFGATDLDADGAFLDPVALADVREEMAVLAEETFGPVACVQRFGDDDEAVTMANDTIYGLGAVVFGGDPDRAAAVARRLDAGMIGVNRGVGGAHGSPWVGAKQSGFGFHSGRDGHRHFAQVRLVTTRV